MIQYQVQEQAQRGRFWYRHGYEGPNEEVARKSIEYMKDTYGKYGRVFRLVSREISEWSEINDVH